MGRASASLRSSDPFPFSFFISRGERWVIKLQITETSPRACVKPERPETRQAPRASELHRVDDTSAEQTDGRVQ